MLDFEVHENDKVISVEAAMVNFVGKCKEIRLFPMGFYDADVAIIFFHRNQNEINYAGSVCYYGSDETKRLDDTVVERMKDCGYYFDNIVLYESYGIAIVRRLY